jgi:hypothetical protein
MFTSYLSKLSLVLFLFLTSLAFGQSEQSQMSIGVAKRGMNQRFVKGHILVKFKDGVSEDRARDLMTEQGARTSSVLPQLGVHLVKLPPNVDEEVWVEAIKGLEEVEFVELDSILKPAALTPNDPTWTMGTQWALSKIGLPDAWSITTGSSAVTIAIIDSGVQPDNPELQAKMVPGWNVVLNNANTNDSYGHGTQVAGVAAAITNNGLGLAGVCWGCLIMPIRIVDPWGITTASSTAAGITWAADHGIKIANLSARATGNATMSLAAQYLWNKGGILITASGDSFPASNVPDNPYILEVGSTDRYDAIYPWSNIGPYVDLVAPGCGATVTMGATNYGFCGTSYSAPIVSGVAALMLSVNSSLTPLQITNILKKTAVDLGPTGCDSTYGCGRIDALAAVQAAIGAVSKVDTSTALTCSLNPSMVGTAVTFSATISPAIATGTVTFSNGATSIGTGTLVAGVATVSTSTLPAGSSSITANYSGDSKYNNSASAALSQNVTTNKTATSTSVTSNLNPSNSGQLVTLTATVSPASATGTITFQDGAVSLGSSPVIGGRATFVASNLPVGGHSITAGYAGDSNDNASMSAPLAQTVNTVSKINVITTVSSNVNPSIIGQPIVLTATVSVASATGTVAFQDGPMTLGSSPLIAGKATFATSNLAVGGHSITAAYSGDSNDNGNVSAPLAQSVNTVSKANVITTVTSNPNPSTAGQSISLTASISPVSATGAITFMDGSAVLGTSVLNGGRAAFATSTLAAGSHSITAQYSGDVNNNTGTSSILVQTVTAAVSTVPPASCPSVGNGAFVGCYFNNMTLSGSPVLVRTDNQLNFSWGNMAPDKSLTAGNFSARWQGNFNFGPGDYLFNVVTSDGMRIYVDGKLMLDQWHDQLASMYTFSASLTQGSHLIVVDYYDHAHASTAMLWWFPKS